MNIGIASLGLIGGSILKRLSGLNSGFNIYAYTRNKEAVNAAKQYTPYVSDDLNILSSCEIVFVCSPVNKVIEMFDRLENYLNKDCLVMDCASVKEFILKNAEEKARPYKIIPSHPMAGTEHSGFGASFPQLFENAAWVITPAANTAESDIIKAENIIKQTGAHVIRMNAADHDKAAALISHFPMLISQALIYSIKDNEQAKQLAASGFCSMTRLAAANIQMGLDMLEYNAENIDFASRELFKSLEFLKNAKDEKIMSDIKKLRQKMYPGN